MTLNSCKHDTSLFLGIKLGCKALIKFWILRVLWRKAFKRWKAWEKKLNESKVDSNLVVWPSPNACAQPHHTRSEHLGTATSALFDNDSNIASKNYADHQFISPPTYQTFLIGHHTANDISFTSLELVQFNRNSVSKSHHYRQYTSNLG